MADLTNRPVSSELQHSAAQAPENACVGNAEADASQSMIELIEWMFFAYREFTGEADTLLAERGFGRAHHRVLHFVHRHPGMRVADLLEILNITKQSLGRVLKQLVDEGYIEQRPGKSDRRERHLFATTAGAELTGVLIELQSQQLGAALSMAGPNADATVRSFLRGLVHDTRRTDVTKLIGVGEPQDG